MTKRPGFEDEEDCYGKFDPYDEKYDRCDRCWQAHDNPDRKTVGCIDAYHRAEAARRKAEWDAKTPEEQAARNAFVEGLRKLY